MSGPASRRVRIVWQGAWGLLMVAYGASCGPHGEHPRPPALLASSREESACFGAPDRSLALVPLDALLEHPERYDGKRVRVAGYLVNGHEDQGLYRSAGEAARPALVGRRLGRCQSRALVPPMKAIWWEPKAGEVKCDQLEAVIEGTFDPCEGGHMDLYAGTLVNVSYVGSR